MDAQGVRGYCVSRNVTLPFRKGCLWFLGCLRAKKRRKKASVDSDLLSHYRPRKGEGIIYAQFENGRRKGARHIFGVSQERTGCVVSIW